MEYNKLPGTDIEVSKICLGTMTWGRQNSEAEAFEQMDYSLDKGVNFFDTAELYPVPATPERYADTEKIIGNWLEQENREIKLFLPQKLQAQVIILHISERPDSKEHPLKKLLMEALKD